jgi:glycerol-3-phosphate acyltransferase PlsY
MVKAVSNKKLNELGSRSVGATNAGRVLGKKGFIITFLMDFLKGVIAVYGTKSMELENYWVLLAFLAVICGHIWPVQLKFRGGKGVSTFLGAALAFNPLIAAIIVVLFLTVFMVLKRFTLSGLTAIAFFPMIFIVMGYGFLNVFIGFIIVSIILIAHRDNIKKALKFT